MTDDRTAHDVWLAFSKQEPHTYDAHRLAVVLRRLHDRRVAGAEPQLTDDEWSALIETLLDRLLVETAAVRDRPAIKAGDNLAAFNGCKSKQICATVCRHRGAPRITPKSLRHNNFR
jgi:hypothetical protein